jgi:uncharacterized membrane protein YecN with MAPEG domain
MTHIPIALGTAGFLGVLYVALSLRVTLLRWSAKVSIGEGTTQAVAFGKEQEEISPLRAAIRAHANFAEYVPIALILLAWIEAAGASHTLCLILAAMLILARIAHPIGMARKAPNPFRGGGAALTWAMLLIAGLEALKLAL